MAKVRGGAAQCTIWLLLLLIGNGRMSAIDISFHQLDWLDNNGGFTSEKSDWGKVTLRFSSADTNLFTQTGNSFVGYVNIVTTVPGGSTNNWAVMNAPVVFNNLSEFDNGYPKTLRFDLGVPRGSNRVASLHYRVTIDDIPLGVAPFGPMTLSGVGISRVLYGGFSGVMDGIIFSGNSGQTAPAPAFNAVGAFPGESAINKVAIGYTNFSDIPVVTNQDLNGCVPASAAQSIKYLTRNNPAFTNTVQNIYDTLKGSNYMNSSLGTNGTGTGSVAYKQGKDKYVSTNGLGITTIVAVTNFIKVANAISNGADVEIAFRYSVTNSASGKTNYSGHLAMVTSITTLIGSNGIVSGYEVEWVDGEPVEFVDEEGNTISNSFENISHSTIVDTNGVIRNPDTNYASQRFVGFYVETTNSAPDLSYNLNGAGKYLASAGQASIVRLALNGSASQDTAGNFSSSGPTAGGLTAFDFLTRTEIEVLSFSLVEGSSLGGGNFTAEGQGLGTVNGVPTIINFEASKAGGVVKVKISDAETGAIFLNGTGEPGRADMQLTITPIGSGPPIIQSVTTLSNGTVQVMASGVPNTSYLVQATTNMINPSWATIGTATTVPNGLALFSDLQATNFPTRFYRLWLP